MENDDLKLPNKWIIGDQIRMIKISNINLEGNLAKELRGITNKMV